MSERRVGGAIKACHVQTFVQVASFISNQLIEFFRLIDGDIESKSWKTIKRFSIFQHLTLFVSSYHSDMYLHSVNIYVFIILILMITNKIKND